jgi:hypothetical protein
MGRFFLALALSVVAASAVASDVTVTTTTVVSADQHASEMARTGVLKHCRILGRLREGIAFSAVSPEHAVESCCFYRDAIRGRYRIIERAVVWSPIRRGWFACIRCE